MALTLNHVHIKSPDPQAAAQFYINTLGATKVADIGENGVRLDLHGLFLNVTGIIPTQTRDQKYGVGAHRHQHRRHWRHDRGSGGQWGLLCSKSQRPPTTGASSS